jgi:hypothetical protein
LAVIFNFIFLGNALHPKQGALATMFDGEDPCGLAVLRSCGLAVLRHCGIAALRHCGLAVFNLITLDRGNLSNDLRDLKFRFQLNYYPRG